MSYYNLFLLLAVVRQLDFSFIHTWQSVVVTNIKQTFPYISPTHLYYKVVGAFLFLFYLSQLLPYIMGWHVYFVNES